MPIGRWGTVREAAEHFKVTRGRIHELMEKGAFGKCRKIELVTGRPIWLIPYPFKRAELKTGRPKGKKEAVK